MGALLAVCVSRFAWLGLGVESHGLGRFCAALRDLLCVSCFLQKAALRTRVVGPGRWCVGETTSCIALRNADGSHRHLSFCLLLGRQSSAVQLQSRMAVTHGRATQGSVMFASRWTRLFGDYGCE